MVLATGATILTTSFRHLVGLVDAPGRIGQGEVTTCDGRLCIGSTIADLGTHPVHPPLRTRLAGLLPGRPGGLRGLDTLTTLELLGQGPPTRRRRPADHRAVSRRPKRARRARTTSPESRQNPGVCASPHLFQPDVVTAAYSASDRALIRSWHAEGQVTTCKARCEAYCWQHPDAEISPPRPG